MDDPGRTAGDYRLVRSLGRGGFGEVFLGEAPDGSRAAVKVLHATWAGDPEMRRRFTAEVEQARRVDGFCIAAILDADPEAAEPWIATEFIDGPTLQAAVKGDGPRAGVELQRLAVGTATALAAIHAAGVVHRDLKPDNIMLAADGPRVIDFGIARALETTSVTASGIIGTVGYMAPEQLEGERLTSAVDVFSWGSVMVYAATGKEAFPGPTQAARIARVLSGEPDLDGVPEPLRETLRTCLLRRPEHRPDAKVLLHHLVTGDPLAALPAPRAASVEPVGDAVPSGPATEEMLSRFRGIEDLRKLFDDPGPLLAGDAAAAEFRPLARPAELRRMAEIAGDGALFALARDLEEGELVGNGFVRELTGSLGGWEGGHHRVDPALILTFLLNPGLAVPPDPGGLPGVGEWTRILWTRVEYASGPPRAGHAAAVYAVVPTVLGVAHRQRQWRERTTAVRGEADGLRATVRRQEAYAFGKGVLGVLGAVLVLAAFALVAWGEGVDPGLLFVAATACGAGWLLLLRLDSRAHGGREERRERLRRLENLPLPALGAGLRAMEEDLRRAREICAPRPGAPGR
ncbi:MULTISPECIES: serine/threonine protein kinase [Nocardiopsidaceae]|uniref:Serine/threonine-protein kinase n=1 Tax=Streptomonospora nanhaiensis TaxID=1323731 RepID=A0ABY6YTQ9_9ACTN|nr:serine/threonine-protein kinase [Streptomonospora nanhaiensis]WAE75386.1 serine/threonine-protein kinase [Streptomonospora nanhaiensis]